MKAKFLINGNEVEIEGTPAELSEMLLGIPSDKPSSPPSHPSPPKRSRGRPRKQPPAFSEPSEPPPEEPESEPEVTQEISEPLPEEPPPIPPTTIIQDNPNDSIPPSPPSQPSQPLQSSQATPISFSKVYHEVLGCSLKDYVAKAPEVSTDSYVIDILNKCRAANKPVPPETRLRTTIEAAKQIIIQSTIGR